MSWAIEDDSPVRATSADLQRVVGWVRTIVRYTIRITDLPCHLESPRRDD
jgi:hypothetical protein